MISVDSNVDFSTVNWGHLRCSRELCHPFRAKGHMWEKLICCHRSPVHESLLVLLNPLTRTRRQTVALSAKSTHPAPCHIEVMCGHHRDVNVRVGIKWLERLVGVQADANAGASHQDYIEPRDAKRMRNCSSPSQVGRPICREQVSSPLVKPSRDELCRLQRLKIRLYLFRSHATPLTNDIAAKHLSAHGTWSHASVTARLATRNADSEGRQWHKAMGLPLPRLLAVSNPSVP